MPLYTQVTGLRVDSIDYLNIVGARDCIKKFRLSQHEITALTDLIGPVIERRTQRSRSLPPLIQVLKSFRHI